VKILWLGSAHPLVEQLVQLRDLYGLDAHIHEDPAPCDSVETAIRRIHGYGANVVVMPCGPTWLQNALVEKGVNLFVPVLEEIDDPHHVPDRNRDIRVRSGWKRHVRFTPATERILR